MCDSKTSAEKYAEEAVSFTRTKLSTMDVHKKPELPMWNPLSAIVEYSDPIMFAMEAWAGVNPQITPPQREDVEKAIVLEYFRQIPSLRTSLVFQKFESQVV